MQHHRLYRYIAAHDQTLDHFKTRLFVNTVFPPPPLVTAQQEGVQVRSSMRVYACMYVCMPCNSATIRVPGTIIHACMYACMYVCLFQEGQIMHMYLMCVCIYLYVFAAYIDPARRCAGTYVHAYTYVTVIRACIYVCNGHMCTNITVIMHTRM